jgi:hypothetical protein
MTNRDHARRLLLVLLANERHHAPGRELDDAAVEAEGPGAVAESGAGRDALAEVRDADDEWRIWAPRSAAWGAARTT